MFPQIFGKYVLESELAVGGMARVLLATLRGAGGFEKRLVVKQILTELASQEDFVERFVAEAKTAVELTHPNIVPVYELGLEAGVYYIAMEYCEGVTLADLLRVTGPLEPEAGAYLGAEICSALDYAHRRAGVVHRDVTPRNVLVDDEGAVRLIDFGIATPVSGERAGVFGSPGHMPPEQLAGGALTPAADVFAVGALLLEAWTGQAPFRRASLAESERALQEPAPPLEVPALQPLATHLAWALARDASERPQSAEEMARPLRSFARAHDPRDVARALGARARAARDALGDRLSRPIVSTSDAAGTPRNDTPRARLSTAAPAQPAARTFATRRLPDWVEPEASLPESKDVELAPVPATRRVASRPNEASDLSDASRPNEASDPSVVLPAPALVAGAAPRAASSTLPRRLGWLAAACVAAGLVLLIRARSAQDIAPQIAAPSQPSGPSAPAQDATLLGSVPPAGLAATESATLAARPPISTRVEPAGGAATRGAATASNRQPAASAVKPGLPAIAAGLLTLTAEPAANVEVAGKRFTTPAARVSLPPGDYAVIFRNPLWPEPVTAAVKVQPGAECRAHADFTREPPRVLTR